MTTRDKLYIIDISGFIHRSYHVHKDLMTSKGMPTGAIYGTLGLLCKFISENRPVNLAICYDAQDGNSVRRDLYPQYKANRVRVNAVSAQELIIRKIISLLDIYSVAISGYEADDLIATVADKFKGELDVVILTGDKDMLQLIDKDVSVIDPMKNVVYDENTAFEKFGVKPSQISDYLALVGDKADNIPGVTGIGPRAAQDLLSCYAGVDEIMYRMNDVSDKYRDKLNKNIDNLKVSKQLADLVRLNIEVPRDDLKMLPKYKPELDELLTKLEFSVGFKDKVRRVVKLYE
jgi:DNA polymerase-1